MIFYRSFSRNDENLEASFYHSDYLLELCKVGKSPENVKLLSEIFLKSLEVKKVSEKSAKFWNGYSLSQRVFLESWASF